DLLLDHEGNRLFVANANSDTVDVIDVKSNRIIRSINVRPDAKLLFGSAPNALALSSDEKTLFIANGGNNAVAVASVEDGVIRGFIPTAWYPGAIAIHDDELFIANVKGTGSRDPAVAGKWSTRFGGWGSVTHLPLPDDATLATQTEQVKRDAMVPQSLAAMERASSGVAPVPVPAHAGEPSVFQHIVYIIKENRTYDQVLGDIGKGNSEPALCIYGKDVTPNQHALADQ